MRSFQFMFYNSSLVFKEIPKITITKANSVKNPKYLVKVNYSHFNPLKDLLQEFKQK